MASIHATATVSSDAELAPGVEIGPYCVLIGRVRLESGVRLMGNNYINGPTTIGESTILYPFACIGFEPQDYKFAPGAKTAGVVIGKNCLIREHATVHAASNDHTPTRVGDKVFLMVNSHVAHDAKVGNNVVFVNGAGVAGHGEVGDNVTLGGNAVIHQFCRIGRLVMMSGDCAVSLDVPPFCMVNERNRIGGLNQVGLRRHGFPREHITELRRAFRDVLRRPMPREQAITTLRERGAACPPVMELAEFLATTKRGITPGMGKPPRDMVAWLHARERGEQLVDVLDDETE
ncbi:MAG: acyl-ACP--UDP-N-acetylglucosamine O-acyltransferase [Phycisphaerales bacterium]